MNFNNYIDITPEVSPELGVFPGDQAFSRNEVMSCQKGDNITLSSITTTVHLGAHADASNHYHRDGKGIESRELSHYMGTCQVVDVSHVKSDVVQLSDVDLSQINTPRILFKTLSFPDPNHWNSDFVGISAKLIQVLAEKNVITIGIDTPSIDPESSKTLDAHSAVFKNNLAILEGLNLSKTKDQEYILMALPLKLKGCDASPVRAILFYS